LKAGFIDDPEGELGYNQGSIPEEILSGEIP